MKRARDIRDQLVGLMERVEIEMVGDSSNHDGIRKSIAAGYFYNTSRLQKDGSYKTVKNPQTVHIHPSSSLVQVRAGQGRSGAKVQVRARRGWSVCWQCLFSQRSITRAARVVSEQFVS